VFADDGPDKPAYGKPELDKALAAERDHLAVQDKQLAALEARAADAPSTEAAIFDDQLRVAVADLEIHRRFLATLETCAAASRLCPPRLDDPPWSFDPDPDPDHAAAPPLTAPLRFDLEDWRAIVAELHGRACACRTLACVDSLTVAIDQLEVRPMRDVQGDEAATVSITGARACLFRLRGKAPIAAPPPPSDD
jgi:hypothetical protein